MELFDIYNQAKFQRLVQVQAQTRIEQQAPVVDQLVTTIPWTDDTVRMERSQMKSFGYAKPKAIGASPNVYVPRIRFEENEVELLQIHEKSPIDERLLRKLRADDPNISQRAGVDIVNRAAALQQRNEQGWRVLVMSAILNGLLVVSFKDESDQGMTIDYNYLSTHFTHVGTSWGTRASSTPIDDMIGVQILLANDTGDYGIHFWMNNNTMQNLVWSAQAKALLTGFDGRAQFIPNLNDITRRMYEPDRVQFHVTDSGYRANETYDRGRSAHTFYIPDNKVIVTTDDPFEGENLIEVFDGRVAVPTSEFAEPSLRQGAQNWVRLNTDSLETEYHYASTRIPRINRPECIVVMDVSGS